MTSLKLWQRFFGRHPWQLAAALVALLSLSTPTAYAGEGPTGPPGGGAGGLGTTGKGGEDTGTVPSRAEAPTGVQLVGRLDDIARLVQSVRGGAVWFQPIDPDQLQGLWTVSFTGSSWIRLNRAELSRGRVGVFFATDSAFGGGRLRLSVARRVVGSSSLGSSSSVRLPLGGIFAPGRTALPRLGLMAISGSGDLYQVGAQATRGEVILSQSVSPSSLAR